MKLFMKRQINGNILPIGKLIDKTFGPGSFRKLGEDKVVAEIKNRDTGWNRGHVRT